MYQPGYLRLFESGELEKRVKQLNSRLRNCDICPHACGIDRLTENTGYCRSSRFAYVCSYCTHHGEETPLSGSRGSGTIFFGNCNLHCVFCQNSDISQHLTNPENYICTADDLAKIMLSIQNELHCHNINFVSPSHFVPQIIEALFQAIPRGLNLPLVYNSNGYDDVETLKLLDGIIDLYLPDLKYASNLLAEKYSGIKNYVSVAHTAVREMYRQVGQLVCGDNGVAQRGLIIRHLVLPNQLAGSRDCLNWIARELSPKITLSLMSQYHPANIAHQYPELSERLTIREYYSVLNVLKELGFVNALYQAIDIYQWIDPDLDPDQNKFNSN